MQCQTMAIDVIYIDNGNFLPATDCINVLSNYNCDKDIYTTSTLQDRSLLTHHYSASA